MPSTERKLDEEWLKAAAKAIYELNPLMDQGTDLDGRPTGPAYEVPWDALIEYDDRYRQFVLDQARACLSAYLSSGPERAAGEMPNRETVARALNALDIADTEDTYRRRGWPIPEKWADPWEPCGGNQRKVLYQRADVFLAALAEARQPEERT